MSGRLQLKALLAIIDGERKHGERTMSVHKRGEIWWYSFSFAGKRYQESTKSKSKTLAKDAERKRRRELEEAFNGTGDRRKARVQSISALATAYLEDYAVRHRAATFAEYALGHVTRLLGDKLAVGIDDAAVKTYQTARLKEDAAPKSVNEEVTFLLRLLGDAGDALRIRLRRDKALKLKVSQNVARAYSEAEKTKMLSLAKDSSARKSGSPAIYPALVLALNAGMRDAEIKTLAWHQVDFEKQFLTVGKSKTDAGEGRTIPLNSVLLPALLDHARWYTRRFGMTKPEWFLFPFGKSKHLDPTRPTTTLKTVWQNIKKKAGITGRWHDTRHTLVTELAESGAGDQTIMDIAGHVSRQMLARYSHIRMEAKRKALEGIVSKPAPAQQAPQPTAEQKPPDTAPQRVQ
jgi:integrase